MRRHTTPIGDRLNFWRVRHKVKLQVQADTRAFTNALRRIAITLNG